VPDCPASSADDLTRIKVRNAAGDGPAWQRCRDARHLRRGSCAALQLFLATEINGDTLPGIRAAYGVKKMEELAKKLLPAGISFEWTDLSYQQATTRNLGLLIFPLSCSCTSF
jgi:multidrug efflux pump subunit AcrB